MEVMREVAGADHARVIEPVMASEDFAFLLQAKPGCYVFLGNGDGDHRMAGHGLGPCMPVSYTHLSSSASRFTWPAGLRVSATAKG